MLALQQGALLIILAFLRNNKHRSQRGQLPPTNKSNSSEKNSNNSTTRQHHQQQQNLRSIMSGNLRGTKDEHGYDYDYVVIGGGSGGIASAKRAASHGAKVAVIERARMGGTCVNVGCVPKKVMWNAATTADTLKHDAHHYGFLKGGPEAAASFDWSHLKKSRDAYIVRLNKIYESGLEKSGIDQIRGDAKFGDDAHTIVIKMDDGGEEKTITGNRVLVATGGRPVFPPGEGIKENCISSDEFFELEELPNVAVVIGAGYIAVELAGVLNSLGSEVHLAVRKARALREFDPMVGEELDNEMTRQGIHIHRATGGAKSVEVDPKSGKKTVNLVNGDSIYGADVVLMAVGRVPNTESLNLDAAGVKVTPKKHVVIDEFCNTSNEAVFALGDDVGELDLTPMAIAVGRRLSDRLFGGPEYADAKVSYENVPTVIFSHPTIGTCGLTEPQAIDKYGEDNIKVYQSKFANLFYGPWQVEPEEKPKTSMKVICAGDDELVVGMHVIGMGADEMLQGFGVAIKMGATKADLDSCVAIHPTASEELVTMGTWGTSRQATGARQSPLNGAPPPQPEMKSKM